MTSMLATHSTGTFRRLVGATVGAIAVTALVAAVATPAAANEEPSIDLLTTSTAFVGASTDVAAIEDAASDFVASDADSSVALVNAAAAEDSNPIHTLDGFVAVRDGALLEVENSGATFTSADGREIGISVAPNGSAEESTLIDGAVFTDDIAPSTDLVTRATDSGVQLVAILADERASERVAFDLELPDGAVLTELTDGSIAIDVPSETVAFDPVESARFDAEVAGIIGDTPTIDAVSAEQWADIDALTPVPGQVRTEMETVALLSAPWAVDGNGAPLKTSYELDGDTLTQVIAIDEDTAFPVVADPSAAFWWKAAKCVGQLGLMALAVAKAASMVVKLVKYMSGLKKTSAVAKAWRSLVGSGSTVNGFKKLASALGELLQKLATKGYSAMKEHATATATLAASFTVLTYAGDTIAAIIGVDECVDLALGRY